MIASDDDCVNVDVDETQYVDDVCFIITSLCSLEMFNRFALATDIISSTFEEYGLFLNWSRGKTEAFITLAGANKKVASASFNDSVSNGISVCDGRQRLRIVSSYCHLGSVYDRGFGMVVEVRNRVDKTVAGNCKLSASLLTKQWLSLTKSKASFRYC